MADGKCPSRSADARQKESESYRQRLIYARKKTETKLLHAELRSLQERLAQLQTRSSPAKQTTNPFREAVAVLQQHNLSLRKDVERQRELMRLLYSWVVVRPPHVKLTPWMPLQDVTLVANPVARHQGLQWLSERVYHNAIRASPDAVRSMDDAIDSIMHFCDDDDDGKRIAAIEYTAQHTWFANFKTVAEMVWRRDLAQGRPSTNYGHHVPEHVEHVHSRLVYKIGRCEGFGRRACSVLGLFEDPTRIVTTFCLVPTDERVPLAQGELRVHGFGWTMWEQVTESITLSRHVLIQFAPVSAHGKVSLADAGDLFRLPWNSKQDHQEAYMEHLRRVVNTNYQQRVRAFIESTEKTLEAGINDLGS
ncbi:Aste57867_3054 [Aphanomyces stellatus]|uniref:Aste57867_3054 protein n=1 Tax=Aphanomyces stellatus TaxID=120398 RepID=A0A485K9Y3_9STRA|nr:hypothetical protein As57867_003045 [Aphanomyces stellatus]VFT80234.1 Aste57867_3054 [Aphanomyces stellatus]